MSTSTTKTAAPPATVPAAQPESRTPATSGPGRGVAQDPWQALGFPSLMRMRQEFEDLWNKFFTDIPAIWSAEKMDLRWSFDVEDQPDAYVVKAEAPGFDPQDFTIELRGDQLVLQARKTAREQQQEKESFTSTEFYRSVTLPRYVDANRISATYKNGVLEVQLPKTAEGKGRRIPVSG